MFVTIKFPSDARRRACLYPTTLGSTSRKIAGPRAPLTLALNIYSGGSDCKTFNIDVNFKKGKQTSARTNIPEPKLILATSVPTPAKMLVKLPGGLATVTNVTKHRVALRDTVLGRKLSRKGARLAHIAPLPSSYYAHCIELQDPVRTWYMPNKDRACIGLEENDTLTFVSAGPVTGVQAKLWYQQQKSLPLEVVCRPVEGGLHSPVPPLPMSPVAPVSPITPVSPLTTTTTEHSGDNQLMETLRFHVAQTQLIMGLLNERGYNLTFSDLPAVCCGSDGWSANASSPSPIPASPRPCTPQRSNDDDKDDSDNCGSSLCSWTPQRPAAGCVGVLSDDADSDANGLVAMDEDEKDTATVYSMDSTENGCSSYNSTIAELYQPTTSPLVPPSQVDISDLSFHPVPSMEEQPNPKRRRTAPAPVLEEGAPLSLQHSEPEETINVMDWLRDDDDL